MSLQASFSGTTRRPLFLVPIYRKRGLLGYTPKSFPYRGRSDGQNGKKERKRIDVRNRDRMAVWGPMVTSFPVQTAGVEAFVEFWATSKHTHSRAYWAIVDRFASWVMDGGLTVGHDSLRAWLSFLEASGASASYINGNFYACKAAILAWAHSLAGAMTRDEAEMMVWTLEKGLGRIQLPTVLRGKRAKMVKEFRPDQLDKVIRGATVRVGTMIEFLADTGLRVSEMTGLRLKNIRRWDPDFSYVTVVGKGGRERSIFVQNTLLDRVRRTFQGKVFLFETSSNRPLDPDNVYKEIRRTFLRVADVIMTPHNLRHYFATKQLQAGVSTKAVADYLGHSSPNTTSAWYDVSTIELERLKTKHHGERGRTKKGGTTE